MINTENNYESSQLDLTKLIDSILLRVDNQKREDFIDANKECKKYSLEDGEAKC